MIVFLCPHGGAKSLIAAEYFSRAARRAGLPHVGVAAAAEDPYETVPGPVAAFLEREGFDVRSFRPRKVDSGDVGKAEAIVAIDCDLPNVAVERWTDVPLVSEDLPGSVAAIRRHVDELVARLAGAR